MFFMARDLPSGKNQPTPIDQFRNFERMIDHEREKEGEWREGSNFHTHSQKRVIRPICPGGTL